MLKSLISYQMYIIIGILIFPVLAFIIYFTKNIRDRMKFVKTLNSMKKPLLERINNIETVYELQESKEEMNMIIHDIRNDIETLKQEINASQETMELDKIDQIEKEITMFYEKMKAPQQTDAVKEKQSIPANQETVVVQETPQQIYQKAIIQQQAYQLQSNQQQTSLHKEQVRVMNENISKFLMVYREKDKTIDEKNKALDEKNKSIYILQQKLNEAEHRLKKMIAEHQNDKSKDSIIEEKSKTIAKLQQRLQEVENKFRKVALLHKSITEKEQIKDSIIQEKNALIASLQSKLSEIEAKLEDMITVHEDTKTQMLDKRLFEIDRQIASEKKKNRIFIILFILLLALGI